MDFVKLDANYQPTTLIEKYSSLIWTERYRDPAGDFELQTVDVLNTLSALPLGTLVSHLDTKAVAIVEEHEISRNKLGEDILKVSGRSATTIMERRAAIPLARALNDPATGNPYQWEINGLPSAVARSIMTSHLITGVVDVKDAIPNCTVSGSTVPGEVSGYHLIPRGTLYDAVIQLLEESDVGLATKRPAYGAIQKIIFDCYIGADKTSSVILQSDNEDFVSTKYYASIKDYITTVYGSAPRVYSNLSRSGTSTLTGFARRDALNDCGDINSSTTTNEGQMLAARNRSVLTATNQVKVFECEVSPDISYVYGQDYVLGDKIKCMGPFGITQNMMVTEYVRIADSSGERGFPGLSLY